MRLGGEFLDGDTYIWKSIILQYFIILQYNNAALLFCIYRYKYKILTSEKVEVRLPWQSKSYNSTLPLQRVQVR